MTEAEWQASDDPGAMLEHLARWPTGDPSGGRAAHPRLPSDRKLRLWVEAVRHRIEPKATWANKLDSPAEIHRAAYDSSRSGTVGRDVFPLGDRAHLLRDIVGNPHRPATLVGEVPNGYLGNAVWVRRDWLTPTVVSLAHAAYDSRDEATGHLDPVRLAVLADALEEAGCAGEECPRCRGTGELSCPKCSGEGCSPYGVGANGRCTAGDPCPGWLPHPLLAHLRSPGPHVRGCWAIDLLTGRE